MAVKNAVAKSWTSLFTSFDGRKWSAWPAGDKPTGFQTSPTLIDTDIVSVCTSGGEFNKGSYVRLFGYNLGRQDATGLATGARVYFRDPAGDNTWYETDNYRALILSKVFTKAQIQELIVQIGNAGSWTAGRALDVKITVNGVDTNVLVGQCTVQPGGRFWFADNVNGSEATGKPDDITKPFRYVQFSIGGLNNFSGIWAATTAQGDAGLRAGDTIVARDRGTNWTDQAGFDGRFCRFRSHTGTAPSGSASHGYIHITAYPGPVLGHAPEVPHYSDPAGGRGCFHGVNSAYAGTYGAYVSISGWHIECSATTISDGGLVDLQNGASNWRVYSNELGPWPSTVSAPANAKAGGVAGNGDSVRIKFNNIHDINCDHAANENHGIYADGVDNGGTYNQTALNWITQYNWIHDIPGGSGYQQYNSSASGALANFTNMVFDHNWIENVAKYGINIADYSKSGSYTSNVICTCGASPLRFNTAQATLAINITHNLLYDNNTSGSGPGQGAVNNDGNFASGAVNIKYNILVLKGGRGGGRSSNTYYSSPGTGDSIVTLALNQYYDPDGTVTTVPAKDATGAYGDPLFTNLAGRDFTHTAGSPVIGAVTTAEPVAVLTDYYGIARPQTGTGSPSGTKNDIGPMQGIGT